MAKDGRGRGSRDDGRERVKDEVKDKKDTSVPTADTEIVIWEGG